MVTVVFCMLLVLGWYCAALMICCMRFFSMDLFLKVRVDRRVRMSSRRCSGGGRSFFCIGLRCCCEILECSIAFVGQMSRHCPHETQSDSLVMVGVLF